MNDHEYKLCVAESCGEGFVFSAQFFFLEKVSKSYSPIIIKLYNLTIYETISEKKSRGEPVEGWHNLPGGTTYPVAQLTPLSPTDIFSLFGMFLSQTRMIFFFKTGIHHHHKKFNE